VTVAVKSEKKKAQQHGEGQITDSTTAMAFEIGRTFGVVRPTGREKLGDSLKKVLGTGLANGRLQSWRSAKRGLQSDEGGGQRGRASPVNGGVPGEGKKKENGLRGEEVHADRGTSGKGGGGHKNIPPLSLKASNTKRHHGLKLCGPASRGWSGQGVQQGTGRREKKEKWCQHVFSQEGPRRHKGNGNRTPKLEKKKKCDLMVGGRGSKGENNPRRGRGEQLDGLCLRTLASKT